MKNENIRHYFWSTNTHEYDLIYAIAYLVILVISNANICQICDQSLMVKVGKIGVIL
jgi:hypothetical protein